MIGETEVLKRASDILVAPPVESVALHRRSSGMPVLATPDGMRVRQMAEATRASNPGIRVLVAIGRTTPIPHPTRGRAP